MNKNNLRCEFSERLNSLCEESGIDAHGRQTALAKIFHVSQEATRKWLNCESIPSYERAIQMCDHFGINFEWLMRGVGNKHMSMRNKSMQDTLSVREVSPGYPHIDSLQTIPLVGRVPLISLADAGNWSNDMKSEIRSYVRTTSEVGPNAFAIKVESNDMEPKFPVGSTIIVDPDEKPKNGSYIIAQQKGAPPTFKQLVIDGNRKYLNPLNQRYPVVDLLSDDVICGVVKQMIMDV